MNVSAHQEAELHAATDRYARAILRMESGDRKARGEMLEAYCQLQRVSSDRPAGSVPPRLVHATRGRD